ncbi:MAG: YcgN family cysteine cluster protein [Pseudomonadota bacterium]|nr:YcgN family cysteine cluster protein [Pseudomonadota bacterium]
MNEHKPFWEKPLAELDRGQWEALCDGCGRCCLHKLEDDETGMLYPTNVACKLLDRRTGQCSDYAKRKSIVDDCVVLEARNLGSLEWLPESCAYRLRAKSKPLPEWHHLISGSRDTVHQAGESTRGWTVNETDVDDLEAHVTDRGL